MQEQDEEIIELSNGCVCCTVRGDLMRTLNDLRTRRQAGELNFERVIIETTGMANPGPVCQTFFMDDDIADYYRSNTAALLGTEGFGQGLWDVKREEYRAKVPASQRKGTEEAARKAIQQTQAHR